MHVSRAVFAAAAASVVASVALTNCSGSGGNSASVVPTPHASPSSGVGPNLYVASASGASFQQFTPTFSSGSTPALSIANPAVQTVAADTQFVVAAGTNADLTFYTQPVTPSSTPASIATPFTTDVDKVVFDPSGDIWAANSNSPTAVNTITEFEPPFGVSEIPLTTVSTDVNAPIGIAFDDASNLYVVNSQEPSGPPELLLFPQPGYTTPSVIVPLPLSTSGLALAWGAAIDGTSLAVGVFENEGGSGVRRDIGDARSIVRVQPHLADLVRERRDRVRPFGFPTGGEILIYTLPLTSSSTPTTTIPDPDAQDVTFDSSGNLYVTNAAAGGVQVFTAPLTSSSTPAFTITSGISGPYDLSFGQ